METVNDKPTNMKPSHILLENELLEEGEREYSIKRNYQEKDKWTNKERKERKKRMEKQTMADKEDKKRQGELDFLTSSHRQWKRQDELLSHDIKLKMHAFTQAQARIEEETNRNPCDTSLRKEACTRYPDRQPR